MRKVSGLLEQGSGEGGNDRRMDLRPPLLLRVIYNVFSAPYIPYFWASEDIGYEYRSERVIVSTIEQQMSGQVPTPRATNVFFSLVHASFAAGKGFAHPT